MQPEKIFFEDDGRIPNNNLPLLLYTNAFEERGNEGAAWLEDHFRKNNWSNAWKNGVFNYHHYSAGVGHKNLGSDSDFGVVGAYPNGSGYVLKTGKKSERPEADKNIATVLIPSTDPFIGNDVGLRVVWNDI